MNIFQKVSKNLYPVYNPPAYLAYASWDHIYVFFLFHPSKNFEGISDDCQWILQEPFTIQWLKCSIVFKAISHTSYFWWAWSGHAPWDTSALVSTLVLVGPVVTCKPNLYFRISRFTSWTTARTVSWTNLRVFKTYGQVRTWRLCVY